MKAVERTVSAFKKWSWPAQRRLIHGQSTGDALTKKEMGGSVLFLLFSDQLEAESRKGHVFALGIAILKDSLTLRVAVLGIS